MLFELQTMIKSTKAKYGQIFVRCSLYVAGSPFRRHCLAKQCEITSFRQYQAKEKVALD